MSPLCGKWRIDLHMNGRRGYVRAEGETDHRGPAFAFPDGVPLEGTPVAVWAGWDTCRDSGGSERPIVKRQLRVKPARPDISNVQEFEIRVGSEDESNGSRRFKIDWERDLYVYALDLRITPRSAPPILPPMRPSSEGM